MERNTREARAEAIADMCDKHRCSEKIAKIHFAQYVDRQWHPHPPKEFENWWLFHEDFKNSGVGCVTAWNCQHYRNAYREMRQVGAA